MRRLEYEIFPFDVCFAYIDIQPKAAHLEVTKVMAQQLAASANAGFQYPLTGDELRMAYDYTPSRM
jgi:hypothetical protein